MDDINTKNNNTPEIPFLKNIGLMLTYKCTIACPHCIVEAGPHRKEEMSMADSFAWLRQASEYREGYISGLALTGGEPFFSPKNLKIVSNYGKELGFTVSVVTSAFWATSKKDALEMLAGFPAIRMLCISTDEYHQRFIPFENIKNVVFAAEQYGLTYSFAVCTPNVEDPKYLKVMQELLEITGGDRSKIRVSITFPVGRAERRSKTFDYKIISEPPFGACSMACSPIVFPDGKVMGCIGPVIKLNSHHPLILGNLRENSLKEILDKAELNTPLHTIRLWGPQKVISLLKEHGKEDLLPEEYISNCICDVCYRMFYNEKILEFLEGLPGENEEFQKKVAYGRLYYLDETKMLETLNYS
jgi:MoaA/NifB/PqqE/SkfB family radical SAM enzyme